MARRKEEMKVTVIPFSQARILPPAPGLCQTCAADHPPELPHNQQSLYYQMAHYQEHGRWPTWDDAMAHCDEEMQGKWRIALASVMAERDAVAELQPC